MTFINYFHIPINKAEEARRQFIFCRDNEVNSSVCSRLLLPKMASLLSILSRREDLTFTLHEIFDEDDDDQRFCFACADLVIGCPTYIFETDDDDSDRAYMHKSCAELPGKIQHRLHPQHRLTVRPRFDFFMCDGCRHVSFAFKYCCKKCTFNLDLQCVSKNEGHEALKEIVEKDTIHHPHKLQLVHFYSSIPTDLDDQVSKLFDCCCCLKSCRDGRDPTYSCNVCFKSKSPFLIHKSCLDTIPRQVQSSFHPGRPLFTRCRLYDDHRHNCGVCDDAITEFALACDECDKKFHVSCGSRTTPGLSLKLHQHDMHYVISKSPNLRSCTICEADCEGAFYRCVKCDVNVHMECIPLPEIVEHESHEYHPLKLTDSVVTHRDDDKYRCDICEEEGNIKHHSYYCDECNYIAHIECVYSEREDHASETKDAEVETDDTDVENDDAEKKSEDEVHDSQDDWDISSYSSSNSQSPSYCEHHYSRSEVGDGIVNIKGKIEELALQLEAVATSDKRIENVKADMVGLVFQLEDLRNKLIKRRYY